MKKILYVLLLLSLSSCEIELKDMYLTRSDYDSDILRIDGYYYTDYSLGGYSIGYFFYSNGVIYSTVSKGYETLLEVDNYVDLISSSNYQDITVGWGIFNVTDSTILIEKYFQSALNKKLTAIFSGEILNDTTFTLNERYKLDQNGKKYDVYEFDATYHFRQYSTKLDSTNIYIK